jgi:hypothetical protein
MRSYSKPALRIREIVAPKACRKFDFRLLLSRRFERRGTPIAVLGDQAAEKNPANRGTRLLEELLGLAPPESGNQSSLGLNTA